MPCTAADKRVADRRILYLFMGHLDGYHGASKHVLGLSGALAKQGMPVRVLCASDKLGIRVSGREVLSVVPEAESGLAIAAGMTKHLRGEPWMQSGNTVIYTRAHHLGVAAWATSRMHRRPLVVEVNGMPEFAGIEQRRERENASYSRRVKMKAGVEAMKLSYSLMLSRARALFVNNPEARDHLVMSKGHDPSLVHVIPLGYDPELARPRSIEECRQRLGLSMANRLIVHVGSLYSYKGAETLLEAFIRIRSHKCSLAFVGDGNSRTALEQRARDAGMGESVRFVGERPFTETPLWAGASDIAVGLSNINPSWGCCPTKVIEYAACGVPVVTNAMAITRDLAKVMPMSLVDDAESVDQVVRSLKELLSAGPRLLRVAVLPPAVRAFAWPAIGEQAKEIISSLAS